MIFKKYRAIVQVSGTIPVECYGLNEREAREAAIHEATSEMSRGASAEVVEITEIKPNE